MEDARDDLTWKDEFREKESSFGIFDVYSVARVSPSGRRGRFIVVDAPDWVTILPVLHDSSGKRCFLMVRQFRHGSATTTLEFPAGVVERDEDRADAAARELREETGRTAEQMTFLGSLNPNPSFMCNTTYTFLAESLSGPDAQDLDELEDVAIETVPVEDVIARMGTGPYSNAIMMAALQFFLRHEAAASRANPKPRGASR